MILQARTQWEGIQNQALGSSFDVEWQRLFDLPFTETEQLRNPLNEDKPVKISRDGQELPPDLGEALVQLFEEGAERNGIPRPGMRLAARDVSASAPACASNKTCGCVSGVKYCLRRCTSHVVTAMHHSCISFKHTQLG